MSTLQNAQHVLLNVVHALDQLVIAHLVVQAHLSLIFMELLVLVVVQMATQYLVIVQIMFAKNVTVLVEHVLEQQKLAHLVILHYYFQNMIVPVYHSVHMD